MAKLSGPLTLDREGIATGGVLIRHLILPSHREDSKVLLAWIAENIPDIPVSLMRQFTPTAGCEGTPLRRKLTSLEYEDVLSTFHQVGLKAGYRQSKDSATASFTPDFSQ